MNGWARWRREEEGRSLACEQEKVSGAADNTFAMNHDRSRSAAAAASQPGPSSAKTALTTPTPPPPPHYANSNTNAERARGSEGNPYREKGHRQSLPLGLNICQRRHVTDGAELTYLTSPFLPIT